MWNVLLLKNNQLGCDNSNSASCLAALHQYARLFFHNMLKDKVLQNTVDGVKSELGQQRSDQKPKS